MSDVKTCADFAMPPMITVSLLPCIALATVSGIMRRRTISAKMFAVNWAHANWISSGTEV